VLGTEVSVIERGLGYDALAARLGRPSAGAARVAVARAMDALARELRSHRRRGRNSHD